MTFKFTPVVEEEDQKSSSFKFTPVQEPETAGFLEGLKINAGETMQNNLRLVGSMKSARQQISDVLSPSYWLNKDVQQDSRNRQDEIYRDMESGMKDWQQLTNPEKKDTSFASKAVSGFPSYVMGGVFNQGVPTGQQFIEQGEPLGTAQAAHAIDNTGNLLGMRFFNPVGGSGPVSATMQAVGINMAQDSLTRYILSSIAEKDSTKKMFAPTWESAALAGINAGVMTGGPQAVGAYKNSKAKAQADVEAVKAKLAAKEAAEKAAKEAPSTPTEPAFMSPSQLLDWMGQVEKSRALHSMERRGGRPDVDLSDGNPVVRANEPDTRITETGGDVPIRVDSGGNAFYPTADAVAARDRASAEMAREQLDIWARENPDEWAALARDNPQAVAEVFAKLEAEIAAKKAADEEAAWQQRGPEIERKAAEAQRARDNEDALAAAENEAKANDLRQKYKNKHDVDPEDLRKVIEHAMTLRHGNVTPNGLRDTVLSILNAPHLRQTVLDIINGEGATLQPRSINGAELTSIVHRVSTEAGQRQQQSETPSRLRNLVDRILYPPVTMNTGGRGRRMSKRSGKVDLDLLTLGLSRVAEKLRNHFGQQKTPSDHILKLTGVDMIKKGPTADEMLARQAAAGPVPEANFWTNWNSGLSMLADKFPKVPLIKDMNQWLRYVHRKIAKSDREVRQPLERLAVQLGKDSQVKMALIAKSESLRKQYYTDAEYAEFGLNPREIKFMRSVQEAHRISNELQSTSAIEALGKGVREQAGYYTHDFSGPVKITATIIGKDGKPTTYRTREDSMAKAKKAEAWLKANRGATDITIEQLHTNYDHNRSHDRTRSSLEALIEIHQGNEDKVSIVKDILSDLERARAEGVGGHDQHLYDKKTFAEGYSGDRPWRSDVENATDWWQKQINMTSETARWAAINEMMAEYKKVMADPEVQKMGKFKDVINEYVLQEMGMRSSTWKAFEEKSMQALMNLMPEKLGKGDVAALKDAFASMKSLAYIKALSASAGYTLVTPIQVIGMGLPEYGRLLANGEVRLKDGTPFILDVMDGVMMGTFEAKNTVFSANQKMWEFFMENDVVPRRVVDDYKNINSNQGVDLTMSTLNFMIAKPDQMARAAAAFAFGKALERGGKYATPEEAWARAAEITSKVAMPITKQDRPLIVDSAGQVGNLAFFLHTPLFATWNAANIFVRNIAQADTPSQKAKSTAAFAFFLAAMAASGGLGEMMGVNELAQLNDIALGGLSYTNPELYANAREINLTKQLLTIFPEHRILNEILNYGVASTAFGIDLGSRFNQGVGDLSKPWESVTGVPGIMKDMFVDPIIGAGKSLMEGSTRPFTQDLANALPPLGRGMLQNDHEDFKSAVQPDEEAYPGYANYRKFGDYKDTSINVTRSPREQERLGRFGLRSLEEGKKLRIDRLTKAEAQRDQRAIASLNEDLSYSLLTKNPENFERKLSALLKLDPLAVDNSISNVVQKIEESGLTQSQKDALKARTMLAYKRVQDNQRLKNATQSSGN